MTGNTTVSRRHLLSSFILTLGGFVLLPGCGSGKAKRQKIIKVLSSLLRYHGVAAHLGRAFTESDSSVRSLSIDKLASEIVSASDLDIKEIKASNAEKIIKNLRLAVQRDFIDEQVVSVDGWLLSQTEARLCALVFRLIESDKT